MEEVIVRGGAHAGESYWSSRSATWPFVLLTVSPTHLKLATSWVPLFRYEYDFPKEAIQKLVLREQRILPGLGIARLHIKHSLPSVPPYIVFGTFEPEELKSALKAAGFVLSAA
jgi:hypothetical protein